MLRQPQILHSSSEVKSLVKWLSKMLQNLLYSWSTKTMYFFGVFYILNSFEIWKKNIWIWKTLKKLVVYGLSYSKNMANIEAFFQQKKCHFWRVDSSTYSWFDKKNEQVMRKRQKKGRDLWNTNVYCSTDLSMQIKKYIYIAQVTL